MTTKNLIAAWASSVERGRVRREAIMLRVLAALEGVGGEVSVAEAWALLPEIKKSAMRLALDTLADEARIKVRKAWRVVESSRALTKVYRMPSLAASLGLDDTAYRDEVCGGLGKAEEKEVEMRIAEVREAKAKHLEATRWQREGWEVPVCRDCRREW